MNHTKAASDPAEKEQPRSETHGTNAWESLTEDLVTFSTGALQAIGRAVTDPGYRALLFLDPDAALSGFDLSDQDRRALMDLDSQRFDLVVEGFRTELSRVVSVSKEKEKKIIGLAEEWEELVAEIDVDDEDADTMSGEDSNP